MPLTAYHKVFLCPERPGHSVLYSTRTAAALLLPDDLITAVTEGRISDEDRPVLVEHGFLVESAEAERRDILGFIGEISAADRTFRPTIVLNLDCNLDCPYCFEGTRKGKHYLSTETADALLRYLEERAIPGSDGLSVTFYGGEPLLSMEALVGLAGGMQALCRDLGILFRFSLVTNGTLLTRERVQWLLPLGLTGASVTLDGPRSTHDAARPFRDGRGSYDLILANLASVAGLIDLHVGGNFTAESWRAFPVLLDDLAAAGITPAIVSEVRFDPVFREADGIANPDFRGGCTSFDEPWLLEATIALRGEILRRGYRTGRVMPARCMLDFPNRRVFDHDGAIYGCPGFIGRPDHRLGSIFEPDMRSDRTPAPGTWKNDECLACAYLPLCFGGCRYLSLLRTGAAAGLDCRKQYFDAVLERMVLQDIRFGTSAGYQR